MMEKSLMRKHLRYGNVIATVALVFALTGGAYAAGRYVITSTRQISPKVLKALTGKVGARGLAGTQGPAGTAGAQGVAGQQGAKGEPGSEGKEGKEGKPGEKGVKGLEGSPWAAGGTLPSEATETGVWSFGPIPASNSGRFLFEVAASFSIPLSAPLSNSGCEGEGPCQAHLISASGEEIEGAKEVTPKNCKGTVAEPTAAPGNLCVYIAEINNVTPGGVFKSDFTTGAQTTGAYLVLRENEEGEPEGRGSWAVTAE